MVVILRHLLCVFAYSSDLQVIAACSALFGGYILHYPTSKWLPLAISRVSTHIQIYASVNYAIFICLLWVRYASEQTVVISDCALYSRISALLLSLAIDSLFYGELTLTPLNFLKQNVWHSISVFYGSMPFHYYLSQGLPILCWNLLPYICLGLHTQSSPTLRLADSNIKQLVGCTCVMLASYTLLQHKEVRFIQPLLPILHVFGARGLRRRISPEKSWRRILRNRHIVGIAVTSFVPLFYLLRYHARGQVDIMNYLRQLPKEELRSVAFLVPCHSTPWQSHLHRQELEMGLLDGSGEGGKAWSLTCEPPIS